MGVVVGGEDSQILGGTTIRGSRANRGPPHRLAILITWSIDFDVAINLAIRFQKIKKHTRLDRQVLATWVVELEAGKRGAEIGEHFYELFRFDLGYQANHRVMNCSISKSIMPQS